MCWFTKKSRQNFKLFYRSISNSKSEVSYTKSLRHKDSQQLQPTATICKIVYPSLSLKLKKKIFQGKTYFNRYCLQDNTIGKINLKTDIYNKVYENKVLLHVSWGINKT